MFLIYFVIAIIAYLVICAVAQALLGQLSSNRRNRRIDEYDVRPSYNNDGGGGFYSSDVGRRDDDDRFSGGGSFGGGGASGGWDVGNENDQRDDSGDSDGDADGGDSDGGGDD